jgi:hypothetical protein
MRSSLLARPIPIIHAMAKPPQEHNSVVGKALALCRTAWADAHAIAHKKGLNEAKALRMACVAYKLAMPQMETRAEVHAAIACIAQGITYEVFDGRDGSQLLYAAQVALSLLGKGRAA